MKLPVAPVPCEANKEFEKKIVEFAKELECQAHTLSGLGKDEFDRMGLFRAAIERLRGQQAARKGDKREFVETVLNYLKNKGAVNGWSFDGSGERFDYRLTLGKDHNCVIEAKGCLDGNNTNIFERPEGAEEFVIWSLCQNPGADPRKNVWSGIFTRLVPEIIKRKSRVDALIVWDMLCGTPARPCPKVADNPGLFSEIEGASGAKFRVPPPCVYLLPKTIPDPRNNKNPRCARLEEVKFTKTLLAQFAGTKLDVVEVQVSVRSKGDEVERLVCLSRDGQEIARSKWAKIKRTR